MIGSQPGPILDLFRGPGGWSTGLRQLGFADLGVEWDEAAHLTALAAGHTGILADVADPATRRWAAKLGPLWGEIASPPCQGFSPAGKGDGRKDTAVILEAVERIAAGDPADDVLDWLRSVATDPRSALVLEPLRYALDLTPEWICWEQVPPVLVLWEACAEVLRAHGYNVWTGPVYAEQYGVPQTRKRAILIASRSRVVGRPAPTHSRYYSRNPTKLDPGVQKWVSMSEALGWGMTARPYFTVASGTAKGGQDPAMIGGSGARKALHDELAAGRWQQRSNYSKGTGTSGLDQPSVSITSKGFQWQLATGTRPESTVRTGDLPAPTLAFGNDAASHVWAPTGTRPDELPALKATGIRGGEVKGVVRVSVAEAAAIQSFPPGYPWQGNATAQYRMVGDAVPPLMAVHVAAEAAGVLLA